METGEFFTAEEKRLLFVLYRKLLQLSGETLHKGDCRKLKTHLVNSIQNNRIQRDIFGLNPIIKDMQTAVIVAEEIGMRRASILGLMLHDSVRCGTCTAEEVERNYGEDVAGIIRGLIRVNELYAKSPTIESENFRNLLLSFAEDMRVILIMIADRVNIMRQIKECKNDEARRQVANEAAYLYAPLAHKLGLYKLKSELEDLSLKYTEKEVYYHIKEKLNETKASRDKYIAAFIAPVQKKLDSCDVKPGSLYTFIIPSINPLYMLIHIALYCFSINSPILFIIWYTEPFAVYPAARTCPPPPNCVAIAATSIFFFERRLTLYSSSPV